MKLSLILRLLITASALVVLTSVIVAADDLTPPPWRGVPGSTYQHWVFNNPGGGPPDGGSNNPYGTPILAPGMSQWLPNAANRMGVYLLREDLAFEIPNQPFQNPRKIIWVQVTFFPDPATGMGPNVTVDVPIPPYNVIPQPPAYTTLPGGWVHGLYMFDVFPNPNYETIWVVGPNILVDQVVIDTWCVPEPGSLMALGAGLSGFVGLAWRRRK